MNTVLKSGMYFELEDGRPAVRFERTYDHPIESVWSAVTVPEELASWFPSKVEYEPHVGSQISFSGDPNMPRTSGELLAYEPPHRLAFTWGPDELRFELESLGDHSTRLTLINVLDARNAAARNAAGWEVCLASLESSLAGNVRDPHSDPLADWRTYYDAYVAGGVPSGAEVPGHPDI